MKTSLTVAMSMAAGIALGVMGVEALHAQGKGAVYTIVETDVTDVERYTKEFAPKAQALSRKSGARLLAATMKIEGLDGTPPKRIAIQQWDSMEKATAWFRSGEYRQIREIGDKYAGFRVFAVEGLPQK
jgi:uncharacterized protein (DUF1330 family)